MLLKRLMALALAFILLHPGQARAAVAVSLGSAVLFSDSGDIIIAPGAYQGITDLNGTGLFACRDADGKICLVDSKGEKLTENVYTDAAASGNRLILCRDGKYGVMDLELNTLVPFEYTFLAFGGKNSYLALKGELWDDIADAVFLVTEDGTGTATGTRLNYGVYALNDLSSACLSGINGRWGYLKNDGTWRVDSMFLSGGKMINGMAQVTLASGVGVINENGDWLVPPFCESVLLNDKLIVTLKNGTADVYTRDSEGCIKVYSAKAAYIAETGRYACLFTDSALVVYDTSRGSTVSLPLTASVSAGWDGQLLVSDTDGAYLYGGNGDKYYALNCLTDGLYRAYIEDDARFACGIIDEEGKTVLECAYKTVTVPAEGYIAAEDTEYIYLYSRNKIDLSLLSRTSK